MSDNSKFLAEVTSLISNIEAERFYAILAVVVVVAIIWKLPYILTALKAHKH